MGRQRAVAVVSRIQEAAVAAMEGQLCPGGQRADIHRLQGQGVAVQFETDLLRFVVGKAVVVLDDER